MSKKLDKNLELAYARFAAAKDEQALATLAYQLAVATLCTTLVGFALSGLGVSGFLLLRMALNFCLLLFSVFVLSKYLARSRAIDIADHLEKAVKREKGE